MAQAEFDDPANLLAGVNDDLLEEVFAFLGPRYIHLALTCRKFNRLLLEDGSVPCCERPPWCHPRGEYIMHDPSGFIWSCCEGSVKDPGCEAGETYQHENDLERERHMRAHESTSDHDDRYSIDSMDWCERYCGCGYADHVYAYCMKSSLMESHPRGFHSDDERSSDEADSEDNSRCDGTAPPSKKRAKREQNSDTSDDEDLGENSSSRNIGTGGSHTERTKTAKDSSSEEHDDESNNEYE